MQTFNVRFRFDDSGLEVVLGKQEEETENAFVGGKNRWEFDSFTNWEFWWPSFPVLVYFKVRSSCPMHPHVIWELLKGVQCVVVDWPNMNGESLTGFPNICCILISLCLSGFHSLKQRCILAMACLIQACDMADLDCLPHTFCSSSALFCQPFA